MLKMAIQVHSINKLGLLNRYKDSYSTVQENQKKNKIDALFYKFLRERYWVL